MRVVRVFVKSASPENDAWRKMRGWADSKDLLKDSESHLIFGYTSLRPTKDEREYGYEFWLGIGAETQVGGEVTEHRFEGGWYAVTTHRGPPTPEVWKSLWDWVQASPYRWRKTHELERPRNPLASETDLVFDLYLPIEAII